MFNKNKKIILWFYDSKVDAVRYASDAGIYLIEDKKTFDTRNEQQLQEFASENYDEVEVLVPDEQSYLKLLTFGSTQKVTKSEIMREIENFIPETIDKENIYWERIGENEGEAVILVRIIRSNYIKPVLDYLEKTDTKIENFLFESEVIAKSRSESDSPEIIVVDKDKKVLIAVMHKGKVWQSITTEKEKKEEIVDQIKIDFEKKWKIKLERVVSEKENILEVAPNFSKEKSNYSKTMNILLVAIVIISLIVLTIFIPMIFRNIRMAQENQIKIQSIINQ